MAELARRRLLTAGLTGVGAAALTRAATGDVAEAASGCPMTASGVAAGPSTTFGRMFPQLPPFAENTASLRAALVQLAAPGGLLDAKDDLFGPDGGPIRLFNDPRQSLVNRDNPHDTAGITFVGQFLDHDITFDAGSQLGVTTDPSSTTNLRTPMLDLDSVYGLGPLGQPELYDPADPVKLRVESGGLFEDVPRRADDSAVIADPRNDNNLVLSGLHAAFLKFHNNAVDATRVAGEDPMVSFGRARQLTTWHWQWLVVNIALPAFVGAQLAADVLQNGPRWYDARRGAYIPVEFSGAAYRFGHSMVRPSYRANAHGDVNGGPFYGLTFDPRVQVPDGQNPTSDPGDLRGGFRSARRFIGWETFFDFGGPHRRDLKPNKVIDTLLSTPLFALPFSAIAHVPGAPGPTVLPQRDLLRQLTWSLPSGQAVGRRLGADLLSSADLADLAAYGHRLDRSTPLSLYVLREADVVNAGQFLGPVGGRLVADVLVGLLLADPSSYLNVSPGWVPTLGRPQQAAYDFASFLRFAGVDPETRGQ